MISITCWVDCGFVLAILGDLFVLCGVLVLYEGKG